MPTYKEIVSKLYGDVISSAINILDNPKYIYSVSPAIDIALSGGIPEGSWVSFAGPPGCGKSTTALQLMANAQKNKRKAFYVDVEHRLKPINLFGVHGLEADKIEHIHSIPTKVLTAEDFLEISKQIIRDPQNFGGILVIDSTSALCPGTEIVDPVSGQIRSIQPKIMASFCRQMAGVVNATSFTVVMIQHLITNTSGYGSPWSVDGGEKIKYQLDVRMITKGQPEKFGDERKPLGQIVKWEVLKSALGQSGMKCNSYIRYGYGLDEIKEICDISIELGLVEKAGSWFKLTYDKEEKKYQGEEKLYQGVKANPKVVDHLFTESKKILGIAV